MLYSVKSKGEGHSSHINLVGLIPRTGRTESPDPTHPQQLCQNKGKGKGTFTLRNFTFTYAQILHQSNDAPPLQSL